MTAGHVVLFVQASFASTSKASRPFPLPAVSRSTAETERQLATVCSTDVSHDSPELPCYNTRSRMRVFMLPRNSQTISVLFLRYAAASAKKKFCFAGRTAVAERNSSAALGTRVRIRGETIRSVVKFGYSCSVFRLCGHVVFMCRLMSGGNLHQLHTY